ncbi:PREDICTED: uncharacterized protein LOC104783939 [Camelina sativa]|uniref:Uncharacterized protein LOC104783939 n=1 Tax=Camelina sativa TaxID=90675 RepID=A0ABM0YXB2_CAMSA|nr:PREDICTED: uncharacterized protein LOC104783939 [Camelina sativa]
MEGPPKHEFTLKNHEGLLRAQAFYKRWFGATEMGRHQQRLNSMGSLSSPPTSLRPSPKSDFPVPWSFYKSLLWDLSSGIPSDSPGLSEKKRVSQKFVNCVGVKVRIMFWICALFPKPSCGPSSMIPCYSKQYLWFSLEEKRRRLVNYHLNYQNVRFVEYFTLVYVSQDSLASFVSRLFRLISILRWAQLAFCVQPLLNHLATKEYISDYYERAVDKYEALFARLPPPARDPRVFRRDVTLEWMDLKTTVAALVEWLRTQIWAIDKNKEDDAMYHILSTEIMYWRNEG